MTNVNLDAVTIDDCIWAYREEGMAAVIHDGRVVGFKFDPEWKRT